LLSDVHLDPLLADGSSSTEALLRHARTLQEWRPRRLKDGNLGLGPWQAKGLLARAAKRGDGVDLRATEAHAPPLPWTGALAHGGTIAASEVSGIEVELAAPTGTRVILEWPAAGGTSEATTRSVAARCTSSGAVQTLLLAPLTEPSWSGALRGVVLRFELASEKPFTLLAVRLVQRGFLRAGAAALATGPGGLLDGGMRAHGRDSWHVWPCDFGVALFVRAVVPAGGRFEVETSLPPRLHDLASPVGFVVDARVGGGAWHRRGERTFVPASQPEAAAWQELGVDLSDLAGREIDLRLWAWRDEEHEPADSARPMRDSVWWGAPSLHATERTAPVRNAILVTLDTTRADVLGFLGGSAHTPVLDRLAAEGLAFDRAWVASGTTIPSHASLLTGLPVLEHGVTDFDSVLVPESRTLAEVLGSAGWSTVAAVSALHIGADSCGLEQGFDHFVDGTPETQLDGADTVARMIEALESWHASGRAPFFAWLHLYDPHTPYGPPDWFLADLCAKYGLVVPAAQVDPPTIGETVFARPGAFLDGVTSAEYVRFLYEADVAYADFLVGRLVDALERNGLLDTTAIAVTADHGEAMGEQGLWYDHNLIVPAVLHVPLLLRLPGGPAGVLCHEMVSTNDLPFTLAHWLGAEAGEPLPGRDLLAIASGNLAGPERIYFAQVKRTRLGVRDGVHHFVSADVYGGWRSSGGERMHHPAMLFRHDGEAPGGRDVTEEEEPALAEYESLVRAWCVNTAEASSARRALTGAEQHSLEELGYAGEDE
jgi:arylsulfatase